MEFAAFGVVGGLLGLGLAGCAAQDAASELAADALADSVGAKRTSNGSTSGQSTGSKTENKAESKSETNADQAKSGGTSESEDATAESRAETKSEATEKKTADFRATPENGRKAAVLLGEWNTAICHSSTTYSGQWLLSVTYTLCNEGEGYLYSSGDVYIVAKQDKKKLQIRPQDPDGVAGSPPRAKVMPGEQKEMWQTWALNSSSPVSITFSDLMTNEVLAAATIDVSAREDGVL